MDDLRHWSDKLQTERLDLYALTPSALHAYLFSIDTLEADMGKQLSREILTPIVRRAIQMKLEKMASAPPLEWPWYTYWLVEIRKTRFGAGLLGYKGPPDDQGTVEIGYGIDPAVAGRGFTTEAAAALIEWAFQTPGCLKITAPETAKDNPASHRVLAKLGMRAYTEDEHSISYQLTPSDFARR
jgi:ribosomal-protein-alanine N-acetyltransferase